jgi:outer membrane protein assembly factor BamB
MRLPTFVAIASILSAPLQIVSAAENWPQWRGPLGTGEAADGDYPVKFSNTEGVAWKVELPGRGSSTPAVWGDRIFVTCAIGESPDAGEYGRNQRNAVIESTARDGILCYDMNGKELWRKEFGRERPGKHRNGTGSNPSPVTDGTHVVAYYKSGTLACFDLAGNEKWRTNVQERFGKDTLWWDLGTSPVLAGGRVIVAVVQEGPSYLAAFDLSNGDVAWKTEREYENPQEADQAYTTPQVVNVDGKDVVVTWGADHLTGHDAATGKLLWQCGGFNPNNEGYWRVIASMTVDDGVALVPYGRGKFLAGVRIGGEGDVTKSNRMWTREGLGADVPTAVVSDGKAYLLSDAGKIVCLALETGDEHWSAELPKNRNKYYASPVLAGDKLYCVREDGDVFVGQVSDAGFNELASNQMGERIIASPVPIRGGLLVRGEEHLFWIGPSK